MRLHRLWDVIGAAGFWDVEGARLDYQTKRDSDVIGLSTHEQKNSRDRRSELSDLV